jgi:hypothetical protein
MNYAGNLHNTLENLMMMSEVEDQDIVNEQIANKDNRILDRSSSFPAGTPPVIDTGARAGRRAGVPPPVLRTRVHVRHE